MRNITCLTAIIITLLLLSSCENTDSGANDFISVNIDASVCNDIIIGTDRNNGSMYYTGLEINETVSVCNRPGCNHAQGEPNCAAQGENGGAIAVSVVFGKNLYFIEQANNGIQLYKCDLYGGGRKLVFSHAIKDTVTVKYTQPNVFNCLYADEKLYFLTQSGMWTECVDAIGNKSFLNANFENWKLFCYDFNKEKAAMLCETGFMAFSLAYPIERLPDKSIAFGIRYNTNDSYGMMIYDELQELIDSPDFNDTMAEKVYRVYPDGNITEYASLSKLSGFYADGARFYFKDGDIYKQDAETGETEIILKGALWINGLFDGALFVEVLNPESNINETLYYKDGKWHNPPLNKYQMAGESKSYFFIYNNGRRMAIKKTDYYDGIDAPFEIAELGGD